MNRHAQLAAFLSFALTLSLLAGYYAMARVFGILGLAGGVLFWLAVVISALLFMAGMGLSSVLDNPSLRGLNIALSVWVGFYLVLIFFLIFLFLLLLIPTQFRARARVRAREKMEWGRTPFLSRRNEK